MTTIEKVAYRSGLETALSKLGMRSTDRELVQRLQEAVADEAHGETEYAETAEVASRLGKPTVAAMATAHRKDEERHGKENKDALHRLYLES